MVVVRTEVPFDYIGETHRSSNVHLGKPVIRTRRCDIGWFSYEPEEQLLVGHSLL